jgi:hypothetical protein
MLAWELITALAVRPYLGCPVYGREVSVAFAIHCGRP